MIRQYQSVTEAVYYTYMDTKLLEFNNIHQTWILINVISSLLHTSQGQICTDLFSPIVTDTTAVDDDTVL